MKQEQKFYYDCYKRELPKLCKGDVIRSRSPARIVDAPSHMLAYIHTHEMWYAAKDILYSHKVKLLHSKLQN